MQEIVHDLSRIAFLPGMQDILTALGYGDGRVAVSRSRGNIHSAGNDAVRVFAVLLGLSALPLPADPAAPLPTVEKHDPRRFARFINGAGVVLRKYWHSKLGPPEYFPYTAKVESRVLPPRAKFGVPSMGNHFISYGPVAAGMWKRSTSVSYHLFFFDLEALEKFIAEIDGKASKELDGIVWSVTKAHDEAVALMARKEYIEKCKEKKY